MSYGYNKRAHTVHKKELHATLKFNSRELGQHPQQQFTEKNNTD